MEQLTDSQINLIVEALLFGACLEITSSWTDEDRENMLEIALNLKQPSTTLKNIQLHVLDTTDSIVDRITAACSTINIVPLFSEN